MRAIRFYEFGDPLAVLRVEDIPLPEPGPDEIRVRLTHRPMNPSDLLTVSGQYGRLPRQLPAVPGLEGAGLVDALGEGVAGLGLGQRVIALGSGGTWQEAVVIPAAGALPVPDSISDQTAAQFVGNPVSAYVMLVEELALQPGDWVLQTAAGSTLGRIVLQLAQLKGYKTINWVRRREQVGELLALGADAAFCTEDDDLVQQVTELTEGGVQGVLDAVGGAVGALAADTLRTRGTMLAYGLLSGQPVPLNTGRMLFKGTTVRGFWLTRWMQSQPPEQLRAVFTALLGLMTEGHIQPPVEAEYDLGDVLEAVRHAQTPGRSGKLLLTG